MKRASFLSLLACFIAILSGCAPQTKTIRPDWQNPDHQRVGAQLVQLLGSAGRDPALCKFFLFETASLNAASLGECTFGFSTGLVDTRDERLIRGVAAHEVAHEVLGHADKRKAAASAEQAIRTAVSFIPGVGGLVASSAVLVAGMFALPAYSRAQEAEADEKAVGILRNAQEPDPAGTMAYAFRGLLAHAGAKGGGLLDSHPGTEDRLAAMLKLQRQQGSVEATPAASTREEPAPPRVPTFEQVAEEVEIFPGKSQASSLTTSSRGGSVGQPSRGSVPGSGPEASKPQATAKVAAGDTIPKSQVPALREVVAIEQLDRGVSLHALSRRAPTAVVLVYREGSPSSERFEAHLRKVADLFAGRASFFRSEITATASELVAPDAGTTPLLVIFRNGRSLARLTGFPARAAGKTPEAALADWLTEHLNRNTE